MNKTMQGYADLYASAQTTSIALNGLLKTQGRLNEIKYAYTLNIKDEMKKSPDSEIRILCADTFAFVDIVEINLVPINENATRLNYTVQKKSMNGKIILFSILQGIITLIFAGITMASFFEGGGILIPIFIYMLFTLFMGFTFYVASLAYTDKRIEKLIQKNFIGRVMTYIGIVNSQNMGHNN